ncbi:DUF2157 domain-containing protein [Legionella sp. CNM-4043-24]|uniref:DUF2157 domain-containing protein n=1 Tax=Legionella sp. CNM-4043-24 TaxID=3421646 RepID=UPI00403A9450
MKISRALLNDAVKANILDAKQADALINFIKQQPEQEAGFNFANVLYYFGGLLAIGAMSLFMNLGWELFGGWGIFFLALIYGAAALLLTNHFQRKNHIIPAGICATFAVVLTPLAVYGLQIAMNWWPDSTHFNEYNYFVKWQWIYMELATLAVGCILAYIYRYPFMIMPVAVTLWYMSMDVAVLIGGDYYSFELRSMVSMYFGLLMIGLAFWVDVRSEGTRDYAFWLYLFGVMAFWGGLSCQSSDSELSKFFYLCINLLMIGVGVVLVRRVFVVFGAIGCCYYLGHLAYQVFVDSMMFPFALTIIGILIIYVGTLWQKHEARLTEKAQAMLPDSLRKLLQSRME